MKELFHASARGGQGPPGLGRRHRRDRQVAAGVGVREVHRRPVGRASGGTAAAASPTARASPTGRWPRWCGCGRGSPRPTTPTTALAKLRATVAEHVPDAGERALGRAAAGAPARPRGGRRRATARSCSALAAVLRAAERPPAGGAWCSRTSSGPTPACSTSSSTCSSGRGPPDLHAHARAAGVGRPAARLGRGQAQRSRRCTSSRCRRRRCSALLAGLVPGLADELRARILERAEGIPLYAVETVRMLLDRGLLVPGRRPLPAGRADRVARDPRDAARPDRRPPGRRRRRRAAGAAGRRGARQDVHRRRAGRARRGMPEADLEPTLWALVRKEFLQIQTDPLLARARPVRLPAGPRPAGGLRDAQPARPQGPPPRRGVVSDVRRWAPRRTTSSR